MRWLSLGVLAALGGCYSMSTLQETDVLGPGQVRGGPQVRVAQGRFPGPPIRPAIDGQVRLGVAKRLELQVGGGPYVGRVGLKALAVDWEALRLAVVVSYQVQRITEDSDALLDEDPLPEYRVQTAIVPLIASVPLLPTLDLLFGVDGHFGRRRSIDEESGGPTRPVVAFAAHIGLARHSGGFRATFIPQCGVLVSVAGGEKRDFYDDYSLEVLRKGHVRWECALGFTAGSPYVRRARLRAAP